MLLRLIYSPFKMLLTLMLFGVVKISIKMLGAVGIVNDPIKIGSSYEPHSRNDRIDLYINPNGKIIRDSDYWDSYAKGWVSEGENFIGFTEVCKLILMCKITPSSMIKILL